MSLGALTRSIRARVVGGSLVLTVAAAVAAVVVGERELRGSYREAAQGTTTALARTFDATVAPSGLPRGVLQRELERVRDAHPLVIRASVYRIRGGDVVRTASTEPGELGEAVGGRDAEALRMRRPLYKEERDDGEHVAELVFPLASSGDAALGLVYDLGPSDRALERRRIAIAAGMAVVAALFLAAVNLLLARTVFGPLRQLRAGARDIQAGDLDARLAWRRDDEIGQLAADFDAMAAKLRDLALEDALTGLPNQRACRWRLAEEVARAAREGHAVTVALLDVDRFKTVNDTLGHAAGDEALRALADALRRELRPSDVYGRLGGDEFLLALVDADVEEAEAVLERLRAAAGEHRPEPDHPPLAVSVGLAVFPRQARDPEELLKLADRALYQAKAEGRDRVRAYAEV